MYIVNGNKNGRIEYILEVFLSSNIQSRALCHEIEVRVRLYKKAANIYHFKAYFLGFPMVHVGIFYFDSFMVKTHFKKQVPFLFIFVQNLRFGLRQIAQTTFKLVIQASDLEQICFQVHYFTIACQPNKKKQNGCHFSRWPPMEVILHRF